MNYRQLRIAWMFGWAILCLLLIGLWLWGDRLANAIGYGVDFPTWLAALSAAALAIGLVLVVYAAKK